MTGEESRRGRTPFVLRDMTLTDREALLELWVEGWGAAMPAIDFSARREWFRERLAQMAREGFVLRGAADVATGRILGFLALSARLHYLDQIVVDPDHWGKGVGEALLEDAKRLSPQGVALDVNQDNRRAIAFYEKHGFRRLRPDRNPVSGLPTWSYGWGEVVPADPGLNPPAEPESP